MKHFKKAAVFLLALVMVFALGKSVFAVNITITNPQKTAGDENATYTAYKILSLKKNSADNTYDYSLDGTSAAYAVLKDAYLDKTLPNGVTLTPTTSKDTNGNLIYNASVSFDNAASFAKWLEERVNDFSSGSGVAGSTTGSGADARATINVGNEIGYYLILNDGAKAVPNLTTVDDQIIIQDKSQTPTIEKTVDDNSVQLGDDVTYTIKGQVPDTDGFTKYLYTITDTMSQGLSFDETNANMKVLIDTESGDDLVILGTADEGQAAYNGNAIPTIKYENNGFVLEFDMTRFQAYKERPVIITYQAKVNENAVARVTSNKAILKYSNDPSDATKQDQTPSTEVAVYTSKIVVDKYKDGEKGTKLSGARFALYRKNPEGKYEFYKYDDQNDEVGWTDAQDDTETVPEGDDAATIVTTDSNGAAEFPGLEDGTYYLLETEAPNGYNRLLEPVTIVVEHMIDSGTQKEVGVHVVSEVPNKNGSLLPNTGGKGTILLTALGVLIIIAGLFLLPKKEKTS